MSGIFYYGIYFQVRARGNDRWDLTCYMSKSSIKNMSSHQPCSLQGFIENATQTLCSLSLQTPECCMRFQVPTSGSDREDVWWLLQMASTVQLIKQEIEDDLPTYKFCGPSNFVQQWNSEHSSHDLHKWSCNFKWPKEHWRLSNIRSRILFAHIVKLYTLLL